MPSSPGPPAYQRRPRRFVYRGISLLPQDALAEGKAAFAENVRAYQEGTVEPRYGLVAVTDTPLAGPVHSLFRLNDPTPGAAAAALLFVGVGGGLHAGGLNGPFTPIDTGYSGDPLVALAAQPVNAPQPWVYVADTARQRKVNSALDVVPIGLAPPLAPPSAQLAAPEITFLNPIATAGWTSYGNTQGSGGESAPTPMPLVSRVDTTITHRLYDEGADGMASVAAADTAGIIPGITVDIGASPDLIVQDVLPPVGTTTIAAILYDQGTSGLCTIQPAGGFGIGQVEVPLPDELRRRQEGTDATGQARGRTPPPGAVTTGRAVPRTGPSPAGPAPPRVTITRPVDYPVNALVLLDGIEVVRILSVAVGADGVMSFRCHTTNTFGAGATIAGLASFRVFLPTTEPVGAPITAQAVEAIFTPPDAENRWVGGIQGALINGPRDFSRVGSQATQPDDLLRFGLKISRLSKVESVRLLIDMDPEPGVTFERNYYVYEWRASDLVTAVHAQSEAAAGLISDAQARAVDRAAVEDSYRDQYGQGTTSGARRRPPGAQTTGRAVPRDATLAAGSAISRQLALGNNVWMVLECRIRDLMRIGTDTALTYRELRNAAILVQTRGTTEPITLQFTDGYLIGGYGPDVGRTLPPYVYRVRPRSTLTGERGNPSPLMRAGVVPRRGKVLLSAAPSADPHCDRLDWFRFGGTLTHWTYLGTSENTGNPVTFADTFADGQIDGGDTLRVDLFQPWPTSDRPRSGRCRVAGTAVEWMSGDQFDSRWAADTGILVNGQATSLYQSPTSSTRLSVHDNVGAGEDVPFELPAPTLLAQPLPALWGGPIGSVWFHFACGDVIDPGTVRWTHGNDPDATSDAHVVTVTAASEPLMNGCFYDGVPYVFSTERPYRLVYDPGGISAFRAVETACSRGLASRWGLAVGDDAIYFLASDGIYATAGGAEAVSLIDPDLRPLFPQEGAEAEPVRGLHPIDFSQPDRLRLTYVDQFLYFDYVDVQGHDRTLVYEPAFQRWTPDVYASGIRSRLSEPGLQAGDQTVGTAAGHLRRYDVAALADVDDPFSWALWTPWEHGDDPRAFKQWGDMVLDLHPGSGPGVTVAPVFANGATVLPDQTIGAGGIARDTYLVELQAGEGVLARNAGLQIRGSSGGGATRPRLYLWEPSWVVKAVSVARRATDWDDLGYKGAKFVQGIVIRANTFGQDKTLRVQQDGGDAGTDALTLTLNHDGDVTREYPSAVQGAPGWTPFVTHQVRLIGDDDVPWLLLDWRWVFEPAPELVTQWETQYTAHDLPGVFSIRDAVIAHESTCPIRLRVRYDDGPESFYMIAPSGGIYRRDYVVIEAGKGIAVQYQLRSARPFRIYKRDCSVRIYGWGATGGYVQTTPFGGPHREDGAGI
jgi:hypothetical protein